MDPKEKALERAKSPRLAALLLDVVGQFVTPVEDPVYDWNIVPLTRLGVVRSDGQYTWRVQIPDVVSTGAWTAPARQCALAWGTRLPLSRAYDSDADPTRVAVLVRAVEGPDGKIQARIGAQFLYRRPMDGQPGTWFRSRGSNVDPDVATMIIGYLNNQSESASGEAVVGVDLDE